MNDSGKQPEDRLQKMLRRWGADQAAREATPVHGPVPGPPRALAMPHVPWAALLAAMLLLAAGVGWVGYLCGKAAHPPGVAATAPGSQSEDLARAQEELRAARAELTPAYALNAEQAAKGAEALALLKSQLDDQQKRSAGELSAAKEDFDRRMAELVAQRDAAADQLKKAQDLLPAAQAESARWQKQADDLRKRLEAAAAELSRSDKDHQDVLASQRQLRQELEALKGRQAALLAEFGRVYLGAGEGAEPTLAARQAAARRSRMLPRLAEVRASADPSTRGLLDRLEVLLTELDLTNCDRPGSAAAFAQLIRRGEPAAAIDKALLSAGLPPGVREWLLETRLILAGAERAG